MPETAPTQLWIRAEDGRVLGPLGPTTLALLAEEGAFGARCEASRDGILFAEPWIFPELRDVLPAHLLGNGGEVAQAEEEEGPLHELVPEGPLVPGTPFRLYYLVAATGASGLLVLEGAAGRFELFFRKGTPEAARSDAPGLDLGAFLVGKGLLSADGLARAEAAKGALGGELLNALFALGLLAPNAAFGLLADHARLVLDRALAQESGRFRWEHGTPPPAAGFPLGGKWDLLCGAGRRLDPAVVRQRLGTRVDLPVMRAGDGLVRLEELRLTAAETRVAAALDGTRTLAAIVALGPADADLVFRTTLFLADLGLASFAAKPRPRSAAEAAPAPARSAEPAVASRPAATPGRPAPGGVAMPAAPPVLQPVPPPTESAPGPAPRPEPTPAPPPRPPPPVARPAPATPKVAARPEPAPADPGLPTDLEGVRAFHAGLEGKDHFEVLGLARSAGGPQVKTAYFRLARAFHPDTAGTSADVELRRLKEAITARLNEAYGTLGNDERRAEYRAALGAGGSATEVDVAAIFAAEEKFGWATIRVKARRFAEALPALDQAIELNPEEGEFRAWRAWTRFCLAAEPGLGARDAQAELDRALELSPKCAMAWLFRGRIAAATGDGPVARDAFRKCLALDAGNVDAQRELRMLERSGK